MAIIPVILSYNHPEITAKAVTSVLNNSNYLIQSSTIPLILIHNGSDLKNITVLKKLFPQIDHLILNSNKGFSGGANAGLDYAFTKYENKFPWILFLTNDCELLDWPILNCNQKPGLLAPWIWARKKDRIDSIGGMINLTSGTPSHIKTSLEFQNLISSYSKNLFPYIPGSAFLIHHELFYHLNGFNEVFGTYWEDIDFSLRAQLKGFQLGEISSFRVRHKIGKTCHKHSYYTTYLYQRNRHWVCRFYINGLISRLKLETSLWKSWFSLSLRLLRKGRRSDFNKLINGIFKPNPLLKKGVIGG